MSVEVDSAMLARYLQGECAAAEAVAVQRWIAADPRNAATVGALKAAFDRVTDDALWQGIAARTERGDGSPAAPAGRDAPRPALTLDVPARHGWWAAARIAAAIGVVALGALAGRQAWWFAGAQQFREFTSARGSRTTVTLRDGTTLVLGPATHLRVPATFGAATRAVELDGEALFIVVHDARHPFVVKTRRTTVRDVGTTFDIRAYTGDPDERVAVAEGEVALPGAALRARDVASIDAAGRIAVRRGVDVSAYTGWVQGKLVFEDTPLRDAARELARRFDLDVTIADSTLEGELVSASFSDQSPDEVLGVVTHIVGAHFERTGRAVVIRRGVVPVRRPGVEGRTEMRLTRSGGGR